MRTRRNQNLSDESQSPSSSLPVVPLLKQPKPSSPRETCSPACPTSKRAAPSRVDREAKVPQFDSPVVADKQVLRLDVAVDDAARVHRRERAEKRSDDRGRGVARAEPPAAGEHERAEEVPAAAGLDDERGPRQQGVVEGAEEADDAREGRREGLDRRPLSSRGGEGASEEGGGGGGRSGGGGGGRPRSVPPTAPAPAPAIPTPPLPAPPPRAVMISLSLATRARCLARILLPSYSLRITERPVTAQRAAKIVEIEPR